MRSRVAFIGLALLASVSFDASAQITLAPLADAYVRDGGNATKNFGKATTLQVSTATKAGDNYDTYLKFDTTAVPAFVQAKLRLFAGLSANGSVSASLYGVPVTTWSETVLNWNNKPARGASLSAVTVKNKSAAWIEIDLTSFLLSERAQGRMVVSVALHSAANASVILKINSKEASKNKPQLVFTSDKAPSTALTAPAANSVFAAPASINLAANVSDPDGTITKVEFFQGATLVGTVGRAPYAFTWTDVAAGRYNLTAKATDNSGVSTTSSVISVVVDALPSVSLTGPADQSTFRTPASFNLSATASDSDGSISKVEFYQGGTLLRTLTQVPYSVAISESVPGVYSYSAKATDNNGLAVQSSSISVTVLADVAPTIALTAPADGSTYRTPASITLSASASDPDGSIARVDFYQGNSLVGTAMQPPYTITIDQSTPGVYVFVAKAVDDGGITTQSSSVSVTVSALPTMYYVHTDQIDTPRVVTDQANKVVWRWDAADPFGASAPDEDPDGDGNRFILNLRLPGQYYDKETGLHYNYFRDYDPQTGRYIESDPIGLIGGMNTYAYVAGNPVALADPLGLWDTESHNYFINEYFRGASEQDLFWIRAGSRYADSIQFQAPDYAFMHAMSSDTLNPIEAKALYCHFIKAQMDRYRRGMASSNPDTRNKALFNLGAGMHAVMDSTSPSHRGFQKWSTAVIPQHGSTPGSYETMRDAPAYRAETLQKMRERINGNACECD